MKRRKITPTNRLKGVIPETTRKVLRKTAVLAEDYNFGGDFSVNELSPDELEMDRLTSGHRIVGHSI